MADPTAHCYCAAVLPTQNIICSQNVQKMPVLFLEITQKTIAGARKGQSDRTKKRHYRNGTV